MSELAKMHKNEKGIWVWNFQPLLAVPPSQVAIAQRQNVQNKNFDTYINKTVPLLKKRAKEDLEKHREYVKKFPPPSNNKCHDKVWGLRQICEIQNFPKDLPCEEASWGQQTICEIKKGTKSAWKLGKWTIYGTALIFGLFGLNLLFDTFK